MTKAIFDGVVVAQSDEVRVVEGISYFPSESVDLETLIDSPQTSRCFWKGKASYWHVAGETEIAQNAAFTYHQPWPLARRLVSERIAFWQGVEIVED